MLRFVYYGHFDKISDCEGWIATSLERAGHYVLRVQRKYLQPLTASASEIIHGIKVSDADFLLLSKTPELTVNHLREIKKATGVNVVFWTFDWMRDPANWRWYAPLAQEAVVCFQTDGVGEPEYVENGINRVELHQGAFLDLHHPVEPTPEEREKYTADVAFCGSLYTPRRNQLVRELRKYPGFKLWGPSTEELWGRQFAAMVACSKIIVCDNYVNDVPGYWSDRVYLTMACGGFTLAAYVEGIGDKFQDGVELAWWHKFETLHRRISMYLEMDQKRQSIAAAGAQEVRVNHNYGVRIRQMVKVLETII